MKRQIFTLASMLIAVVAMMLTLASCSMIEGLFGGSDEHQHTYSADWSKDETNHWHAATCTEEGCTEAKASVEKHVDSNGDKFCDACDYDMGHDHAFADDWSMDAENHWHASSCGHIVEADKEAHDFVFDGYCSVCGYIEGTFEVIDVAKAVNFGKFFRDLIKSGEVTYSYVDAGETTTETATYEYGNNVITATVTNLWGNTTYWYSVSSDKFLAVSESVWDPEFPADVTVDFYASKDLMGGFRFGKAFNSYDADEFYGADALVVGLYALATADFAGATQEYVTVADGVTYYAFKFANYANDSIFEVEVVFTLADDNSLETVNVNTAKYEVSSYNWETMETVNNVELVYDEEDDTKVVGYELLNFNPTYTFSYEIEQKSGERTLASKYDADKLRLNSFDLKLEDGTVVTDTVNVVAGEAVTLYLDNIAPDTFDAYFERDLLEVSEENYRVIGDYDEENKAFVITAYGVGEFDVTISSAYVEKTIKVIAANADITSLGFEDTNEEELSDKEVFLATGATASFDFVVVANRFALDANTAVIKDAPAGATLVNNEDGTYTFSATALGTYEIVATSTVAEDVTATLVVTVVEAPAISDVLNGKYSYEQPGIISTTIIVEFAPASEGATEGTMTVSVTEVNSMMPGGPQTTTEVYAYAWTDGALVTTVDGEVVDSPVAINADYVPTYDMNGFSIALAPYVEPSNTPEAAVAGTYYYDNMETENRYYITLNEDGTGSFVEKTFNGIEYVEIATLQAMFTVEANDDGSYNVTIQFQPGCPVAAGTYRVGLYEGRAGSFKGIGIDPDNGVIYVKDMMMN